MSIRVIIADDHAVIRDGIKAALAGKENDIEIVAEACNGKELLDTADHTPADVYIIDISMPVLNGIEATERLLRKQPNAMVVMLSMHDSANFLDKCIKAGARGYLVKENAIDEILQAIREVHMGRFYVCSQMAGHLVQSFLSNDKSDNQAPSKMNDLTPREREVLQLVAEGHTTKDIAHELDLSVNTVHVHKNNIMRKLDIHKQADLIRFALKEGISEL